MSFLDKNGVARLWQNIVALADTKVPTSRTINGKTLDNDIVLSPTDIGAPSIINGESADYDMDTIIKSGKHFKSYYTNGSTLGTPAAYGDVPSTFKRALIISYSGVANYGFQIAYPNGLPYALTRRLNNGVLDEHWQKIYSEGYMPTAADIGTVKLYGSFEELGLTEATATAEAIVTAMADDSMLMCNCSGTATTAALGFPANWGLLTVIKKTSSYTKFDYVNVGKNSWFAYYNQGATGVESWTGWLRYYHTGNKPTTDDIGAASTQLYAASITTTWSGSAAPYTQTITVNGILATDTPIVDVDLSSVAYADKDVVMGDYSNIYRIVTSDNKITVYSDAVTSVNIPIQLKVVR